MPLAPRAVLSLACLPLLVAAAAACHKMRPVEAAQLSNKTLERVWVTKTDDLSIVIVDPQLRGDTLAGFVDGAYQEMPLSQARSMRAREPDYGRTALLAGAATAAALASFVYFENRSYVGGGEACSEDIQQQQQIDLHCGGPCPC
jgi:hypothetical protein